MPVLNCFILLFLGVLFIVVTPPFQVPDEPNHFFRAYQVSEGEFIPQKKDATTGGSIPKSLLYTVDVISGDVAFNPDRKQNAEQIFKAFRYPLRKEDVIFAPFPNTAFSSPVPYIPQAAGLAAGKLFDFSPVLLLYLARLCNLMFFVLLCGAAMWTAPFFRNVFMLIAGMPMTIFLAASASADAATFGFSFLVTAHVLNMADRPRAAVFDRKYWLLLCFCILLSFCKSIYFVLSGLFRLASRRGATGRAPYVGAACLLIAASTGSAIFWGAIVEKTFTPVLVNAGLFSSIADAKAYIFAHPLEYATVLLNSIVYYLPITTRGFVGTLGWLDTDLPLMLVLLYFLILLIVSAIDGSRDFRFHWTRRTIVGIVVLAGIWLVLTSQYIVWTAQKSTIVGGLQGRYFIPFGPLVFLSVNFPALSGLVSKQRLRVCVSLFVISSLVATLSILVDRYYLV